MTQDVDMEEKQDDWVRIVSAGGYSFIIPRKIALCSGTLRNMLSEDSNFAEAVTATCRIDERAPVVEKLLEYLTYKWMYENAAAREEIPDFEERVVPEIALELLMAADYLET